jgi:hypothetical protein
LIVEITTFRLAASTDDAAFREADQAVQEELSADHRGLIRRTTARGRDGEWAVVTLWGTADDAAASRARGDEDVLSAYSSLIDHASLEVRLYEDLGG